MAYGAYATNACLRSFGDGPAIDELGWVIQGRAVNNWGGKADDSSFGKLFRLVDRPRIVFQSENYAAIEAAVLAGIGAGFISHLKASRYPDLVPIRTHDLTSQHSVWILTHRDLRDTVKVSCFMDFIADRLRKSLAGA